MAVEKDVHEIPLDLDRRGTVEITNGDVTARVVPASLPAFLRNGWTGKDANGKAFPDLSASALVDRRGLVAVEPGKIEETPESEPAVVRIPAPTNESDDKIWVAKGSAAAFERSGWTVVDDQGQEVRRSSNSNPDSATDGLVHITTGSGDGKVESWVTPSSLPAFEKNGWSVAEKPKKKTPAQKKAESQSDSSGGNA